MRILLAFLLMCNLAHATQGDVNGDGLVGLEEAIYALQVTSGVSPQPGFELVHCDGNPYGGIINDVCGVCGGDGSTCLGCDGVPYSGLVNDACGICGGDGSTCAEVLTVTSVGQVWMDRNLGASRVATHFIDTEAYGGLYQWGRGTDGHEKRDSPTTSTKSMSDSPGHGNYITGASYPLADWRIPQNANLWQGLSGINNPCPSGFRIPTNMELELERASWSSNDAAGAFSSPLKLTTGGYHPHSDELINNGGVGLIGLYWSSTADDTADGGISRFLFFNNEPAAFMSTNPRGYGFSVRCIKEEAPGTAETVTSATGQIWMNRNLGASRVAISETDSEAYGDLYQWGRGTDGHEKRNSAATSTKSASDTPGHDMFITEESDAWDWRSGQNDSLWQGVSGTNNPCPPGFRLPTRTEFEIQTISWSNAGIDPFESPLKLPSGGIRYPSGSIANDESSSGSYWTSTVDGSKARFLIFDDWGPTLHLQSRTWGMSVRCIED